MTIAPVVVGIDGSSTSRQALTWAAQEARLRGAPLRVIHARRRPASDPVFEGGFCLPPIVPEPGPDVPLDTARDLVHETAPGVPVEAWVLEGAAASVLREEAENGATLLVVGSRGHGALGSLFLGSVSARLAADAAAPVVVVPPGVSPRSDGPVVIGVDGSTHSTAAVRAAALEASVRGVPLDLVCAYTVAADLLTSPLVARSDALRTESTDRARRVVEAAAQTAHEAHEGVEVRTFVVEGTPSDAIAQVAGDTASLVAVGSRGHGRVLGPVLGSVSQSVLHHARWPVLVAHGDVPDGER
ncbi:universal stress protein [Oerskovia gallyi]|uniref:Universal stress protein n=1 Tax=Oerskovia gallyi TaxID=2762226 RepID=A0ABR8V0P4_9CELL|nr:universal stress protein [Oerskovia gallyi]MBD7998373.1 universal stress protein [Oerskovia gallyi]